MTNYPTDPWPATALGLLLLGETMFVPGIKPAACRGDIRQGVRELQQRGWPISDRGGRYSLRPDARRAALRDGGVDWATGVLSGLVVRRDGDLVELTKGAV